VRDAVDVHEPRDRRRARALVQIDARNARVLDVERERDREIVHPEQLPDDVMNRAAVRREQHRPATMLRQRIGQKPRHPRAELDVALAAGRRCVWIARDQLGPDLRVLLLGVLEGEPGELAHRALAQELGRVKGQVARLRHRLDGAPRAREIARIHGVDRRPREGPGELHRLLFAPLRKQ
jgi:hypothetical protein